MTACNPLSVGRRVVPTFGGRIQEYQWVTDLETLELRKSGYPRRAERVGAHVQPDWGALVREYRAPPGRRRARLTQRQLWVEYSEEAMAQGGTAYSCSQFCALLKERLEGPNAQTDMRFDYAPGLYGMSDFSGKTLALRTATGETDVEIFVAVLPHSDLTYAEAVPDQKVCHWTWRTAARWNTSVDRPFAG